MRFTPRTRYIPSNPTITERAVGVVYSYDVRGKLAAVAYAGKSNKPSWHYTFRSQESLDSRTAEFFAGLEAHQRRVIERRQESKQAHTLQLGQIVYNSWGYEQTNVDFYQVVRISAHFVWMQRMGKQLTEDGGCGPMSGHVVPTLGTASGELTKHSVRMYESNASIRFEFGAGGVYDGKPKYCSWYA